MSGAAASSWSLHFDRDQIVFNPMLTGRLGLAVAGAKPWPQWAAAFCFTAIDERARNDLLNDRARADTGPSRLARRR